MHRFLMCMYGKTKNDIQDHIQKGVKGGGESTCASGIFFIWYSIIVVVNGKLRIC